MYSQKILFIVSIIYLQLTINWFVLYHAKSFEEKYLDATLSGRVSELEEYRNRLVEICNELSKDVDRDESGYIIYDGDINAECIKLMKDLGKDYKELSGYYPRPKKVLMSGFMSQQYVSGIYYPFSMEANINGMMYLPNYPATICHELSHLKGIISEDEANFIGYLACIKSNIPRFS